MIGSGKDKGVEKFFYMGSKGGINAKQAKKVRLILGLLDSASVVEDLDAPGLKLHRLKGARKQDYAVTVNGNWRVTFQFQEGNAYVTHYEDYH